MGDKVAYVLNSLLEILVNKQRYKLRSFWIGIDEAFKTLKPLRQTAYAPLARD